MLTAPLFYAFDIRSKPGTLICYGVRFEKIELPAGTVTDETTFPILCRKLVKPEAAHIDTLKDCVARNL